MFSETNQFVMRSEIFKESTKVSCVFHASVRLIIYDVCLVVFYLYFPITKLTTHNEKRFLLLCLIIYG